MNSSYVPTVSTDAGMSARPLIAPALLRELSRVDTRRWLLAASMDWALIAAAMWMSARYPHWLVWVAAVVVIGNRQHALAALVHEGAHCRVAKPRWLNNLIVDLFAGYPLFLPATIYRVHHLLHHQWIDTPEDPEHLGIDVFPGEWTFPMSRLRLAGYVLRDLTGLWPRPLYVLIVRGIWGVPAAKGGHLLGLALMHGAALLLAWRAGSVWFYLGLWLLPLITVFVATFRLRSALEHYGIDDGRGGKYTRSRDEIDVVATTRTVDGFVGRLIFGPHAVNYHTEHHLYPSVPFHNLPKLAAALRGDPEYRARNVRTSYWSAVKTLTRGTT